MVEANTIEDRWRLLWIRNGDTGVGIRIHRVGHLIAHADIMYLVFFTIVQSRCLHVSIYIVVIISGVWCLVLHNTASQATVISDTTVRIYAKVHVFRSKIL